MARDDLRLGDVHVRVVCEGYAPLELGDEMPGERVDWAAERARYPWAFHDDAHSAWHVHAFALHTAHGVVMVDSGIGAYPPIAPWAEACDPDEALAGAGVRPDDVVAVVLTHLHADHAGGTVRGGTARFRKAKHHVHPDDWAFFARPERVTGFTARGPMSELETLGLVDLTSVDHEVVPGVRVVHTPGHTPGHRSVLVGRDADTLLITGDLLHVPLQVARPEVPSNHDVDAEAGCRSRLRMLEHARLAGWRVAVTHFGLPFGRVEAGAWRSLPGPG